MSWTQTLIPVFFLVLFLFVAASAQTTKLNEDSAVYSQALREVRKRLKKNGEPPIRFVIIRETLTSNRPDPFDGQKSVYRNFANLNQESIRLDRISLNGSTAISLAEMKGIESLIEKDREDWAKSEAERFAKTGVRTFEICGAPWKHFYDRFPGASGYYRFSRVGFSNDRRFALVQVNGEGQCWDSRETFLFRRKKWGWVVYAASGGFSIS